jgi:hypothetical protein
MESWTLLWAVLTVTVFRGAVAWFKDLQSGISCCSRRFRRAVMSSGGTSSSESTPSVDTSPSPVADVTVTAPEPVAAKSMPVRRHSAGVQPVRTVFVPKTVKHFHIKEQCPGLQLADRSFVSVIPACSLCAASVVATS